MNKMFLFIEKNINRFMAVLVGLHIACIIGYLYFYGIDLGSDAMEYITIADNFISTGMFLDASGFPIVFRVPGFPFYLAVIYIITGHSNAAVIFMNVLMDIMLLYFIYKVVAGHTRKAYGFLACMFWIMDFAIYRSISAVATDLPFAFMIVLAVFLLDCYLKKGKHRYLVIFFITLIIAMLFRPTIMYFNMILCVILLVCSIRKKLNWKLTVLYIALFAVTFGGWSLRNKYYYGEFVYTDIRDESVYIWYGPDIYEYLGEGTFEEGQEYLHSKLLEKYPDFYYMEKKEQVAAYKDIGSTYVNEHLDIFLIKNVEGLFLEMFGPNYAKIIELPIPAILQKLFALVVAGILFVLYLIYALGFFLNIKKWKWPDWAILLTSMYFMASTAVLGYSRYRMTFYPLCIIGAFLSWRFALNQKEDRGSRTT